MKRGIATTHHVDRDKFHYSERKPPMIQILDLLRTYDVDRISPDDAITLVMFAKLLRSEYEARQMEAPEWLGDKIRQLDRWITSHRRDALELRLKEARAQAAVMLTPDQKRAKLNEEIEALEKQLSTT